MHELVATVEVLSEIITKLRVEKAELIQRNAQLTSDLAAAKRAMESAQSPNEVADRQTMSPR